MIRPRHTPRIAGLVAASLAALAVSASPASAQEEGGATVFPPVNTTAHKLFFSVSDVPAEEVRSARIRLHSRKAGRSWTRRIGVSKVRGALEGNSRLVLRRAATARGRLKVKAGDLAPPTDPPTDPPPSEPPPETAIPSEWDHVASFENSLNEGTQYGWTTPAPHKVTRTSEGGATDGSYAAKIVTNGGSEGCSCPRMGFEDGFRYGPGDEVWMSGSWRIPNPSKVNWSRLMNLGHYEGEGGNNWYLALESTSAGTFQVSRSPYGDRDVTILPARPIPANRWFTVDLHFKLSPNTGQALTEWYIDGELVGSTTKRNMRNSDPLHFFHGGLPYFWPGNGDTTVYFDEPRLTSVG